MKSMMELLYKCTQALHHQHHEYVRWHVGATAIPAFKVGDLVWYYNPTRKKGVCSKLTSPWKGPYAVVQLISDVTCRIQLKQRSTAFVVHVDTLKPYQCDRRQAWLVQKTKKERKSPKCKSSAIA